MTIIRSVIDRFRMVVGYSHSVRCSTYSVNPTKQKPWHEMLAFYAQFVEAGDLCFDVGANIGNRTDIFLALGARVICIEPHPKCLAVLNEKYNDNPNVVIVPTGVSAQKGIMPLSICESANTIATFSEKWKTGRFRDYTWESVLDVPVTTLDDLIQEYGVPILCKIDVEGFEPSVLQGLSSPIRTIFFEFTKEFIDDAKVCMGFLTSLGSVEFNCVIGESLSLVMPQWTDADTLLDYLHRMKDDDLWGDIYARFHLAV